MDNQNPVDSGNQSPTNMTKKQTFSGWSVDHVKVTDQRYKGPGWSQRFRAEVHLDGKHVGFAFNYGWGQTMWHHKPGQKAVHFPTGLIDHIDRLIKDVIQNKAESEAGFKASKHDTPPASPQMPDGC